MSAEAILTQVITQEFHKYTSCGWTIKLKATREKRVKYSLWCGAAALLLWPMFPITLIVYILLMANTNDVKTILSIAKKYPDTPVDQIIAWEIRR